MTRLRAPIRTCRRRIWGGSLSHGGIRIGLCSRSAGRQTTQCYCRFSHSARRESGVYRAKQPLTSFRPQHANTSATSALLKVDSILPKSQEVNANRFDLTYAECGRPSLSLDAAYHVPQAFPSSMHRKSLHHDRIFVIRRHSCSVKQTSVLQSHLSS